MSKLNDVAKELLANGTVEVVIGYAAMPGSNPTIAMKSQRFITFPTDSNLANRAAAANSISFPASGAGLIT